MHHDQEAYSEFIYYVSKVAPKGCPFHIGDKVTFTNSYGCEFKNLTVIGFDHEPINNRIVHLDSECWWFPKKLTQLKLERYQPWYVYWFRYWVIRLFYGNKE